MDCELNDLEEAMLQAIARWLRSEMVSHLKESSPSPDLLHDLAQTNYEISCSALANVGLLAFEDQYWRVKDPKNDQTALAGRHNRRQLNDLLDGLVCHSDYVPDLRGEFFTPTETALQDVCRAMAECGYMYALTKDTFEWSEKLGPWLVRHRVWDLNDYEHAPEEEIDRVLGVLPVEAKAALSRNARRCRIELWWLEMPDGIRTESGQIEYSARHESQKIAHAEAILPTRGPKDHVSFNVAKD